MLHLPRGRLRRAWAVWADRALSHLGRLRRLLRRRLRRQRKRNGSLQPLGIAVGVSPNSQRQRKGELLAEVGRLESRLGEVYEYRRAADARAWLAWYYLSGIVHMASARVLLNEFELRARVARAGPCHRNGEKQLVIEGFSKCARADFLNSLVGKLLCFYMFWGVWSSSTCM